MAIRPVDLQLAYLAAPQNAAQVNAAENAPQAAQAAAQSAFINELEDREETVEQTQSAKGSTIQTNPDGGGNGDGYTPQERQHKHAYGPDDSPLGLSADGEHFIDVTV